MTDKLQTAPSSAVPSVAKRHRTQQQQQHRVSLSLTPKALGVPANKRPVFKVGNKRITPEFVHTPRTSTKTHVCKELDFIHKLRSCASLATHSDAAGLALIVGEDISTQATQAATPRAHGTLPYPPGSGSHSTSPHHSRPPQTASRHHHTDAPAATAAAETTVHTSAFPATVASPTSVVPAVATAQPVAQPAKTDEATLQASPDLVLLFKTQTQAGPSQDQTASFPFFDSPLVVPDSPLNSSDLAGPSPKPTVMEQPQPSPQPQKPRTGPACYDFDDISASFGDSLVQALAQCEKQQL
eukprot:TRINITY_DN2834_c0_g1_i10.p1 TRINITY_DN2834_c0_g1~~TRINITY_DN2834_c0_g1_i10.p1  ORF type:complete len:310 (-),score=74.95 TRINITY_DN2834_c0_g1_i10:492-1385(-)